MKNKFSFDLARWLVDRWIFAPKTQDNFFRTRVGIQNLAVNQPDAAEIVAQLSFKHENNPAFISLLENLRLK